ncbi:MAG: serine/threonine-protein kinase [Vicinamibacteria bacterium]
MTPDIWSRARALFEQAVERDVHERAAFLDDACRGDDALRAAVDTLLRADAEAHGPLDESPGPWIADALLEAGEAAWLGRRLGPYQITGVLGRGGMGTVFEASRDDLGFERKVAAKVMRSSLAGTEARLRFEQERRILASLEHPYIARLLDGGETDEGLPWLAMERVEGEPITAWSDRKRLSLPARVRLLAEVCDAVAYAHRHLVVHRDLKPANVFVDSHGRPRLLDFGVAKLLDAAPGSDMTGHWQRILTPDYASPEQVAGRPVSTASDVYSLGVMLYELLVGRRPVAWAGLTPDEVQRRLERELPPLPSRAVRGDAEAAEVARVRATSVGGLRRALCGDLDRMTMMALRPAAAERYASVEALAADLRRWLGGFAVLAAGSGRFYRARKFLRRHRVALVATAGAAGGLAVFATMAVLAGNRAERQRLRAEAVTELLVGAFSDADPERNRGTVTTAREVLDNGARRLLVTGNEDPLLAADLARAVGAVYLSLGLYDQAQPLLERAEREAARGGGDPLTHAALQQELAELRTAQARFDEARAHARAAVAGWRTAGRPEAALETERLQARIENETGRRNEAAALLDRVLREQEAGAGSASEAVLRTRIEIARTEVLRGEPARAEAVLRAATRPTDARSPLAVALDGELSRVLMRLHRPDEAETLARSALEGNRRIWGSRHPRVAEALTLVGNVALERGRGAEAQAAFEEVVAMRRELYGPRHPTVASALYNVALTRHRHLARPDLAEPIYREAVEVCEAGRPAHPSPSLAAYLRGWGRALADTGRLPEAERQLDRARILYVELGNGGRTVDVASTESDLAGVLASTGREKQAASMLRTALLELRAEYGAEHRITRRAEERLKALEARGL